MAEPIPVVELTTQRVDLVAQVLALCELDVSSATPDQFADVGARVCDVQALISGVAETFDPMQKRAHAAWQEVIKQRKEHEGPLMHALARAKQWLSQYVQIAERRRQEEQARLERAAREEDARRLADARNAEEATRRIEAAALEATGRKAEALALLNRPLPEPDPLPALPPPVLATPPPSAPGISIRETWHAEVTDLQALVRAIAEDRVPATLLRPDPVALGQFARATKGTRNVPGIRVWAETNIAAKRASS